MSYDMEFSAGADMQGVMRALENVEKSLAGIERAAAKGFGNAERHANRFVNGLEKMATGVTSMVAVKKGLQFLGSSLAEAAQHSEEASRQLGALNEVYSALKDNVGRGLSSMLPDVKTGEVTSRINAGFRISEASAAAAVADPLGYAQSLMKIAFGGFEAKNDALHALAQNKGVQGAMAMYDDEDSEKKNSAIKSLNDIAKRINEQASGLGLDEYAKEVDAATTRFAQSRKAIEAAAKGSGVDTSGAIAAAERLLTLETERAAEKRAAAVWAEDELRMRRDQADIEEMITRDRARARGLESLGRDSMGMGIETLRTLGADRDAQRLRQRMQAVDAIDALTLRTDITDGDKARVRGEMAHQQQWQKDALELAFMAEDERAQRVVSSRGYSGGLAGANAGVSAAALSGSLDPSLKAAQQTATQTKESARLLAEIEKGLRKREAAVYGN